jgi:hypothetical protein
MISWKTVLAAIFIISLMGVPFVQAQVVSSNILNKDIELIEVSKSDI